MNNVKAVYNKGTNLELYELREPSISMNSDIPAWAHVGAGSVLSNMVLADMLLNRMGFSDDVIMGVNVLPAMLLSTYLMGCTPEMLNYVAHAVDGHKSDSPYYESNVALTDPKDYILESPTETV